MIQVTESDLRAKVAEGWKKKALAEHYGLPVAQMTRVLKQLGLTIRKFHAPKFEIIMDVEVVEPIVIDSPIAESMEIEQFENVVGIALTEEDHTIMEEAVGDVDFEEVDTPEIATTENGEEQPRAQW